MRYENISPRTLGEKISIKKERLPDITNEIDLLETNTGMLIGSVRREAAIYSLEVNVAERNGKNANEAWLRLAAWAKNGGQTGRLEPEALQGKAYDAIFESITPVETVSKNGTCKITWLVTSPHPYSVAQSVAAGTDGIVTIWNAGSTPATFSMEITPETTQNGLTISMDGKAFFSMTGTVAAGKKVTVDMEKELITVDGADKSSSVTWDSTDYTVLIEPGRHTISSSAGGKITVRWHERWG